MEKEEKYIGDMYLAAAFLAYNIPLDRVDRSISRRQKFIFSKDCPLDIYTLHSNTVLVIKDATLEDIETNFASNTLMFPPSYPDAIRRIKSLIHSDDRNDIHLER
jgi:hypothetical protein